MNKEIFKLAIPNVLSNLAIPIQSSIDTIIMGRFSAVHIAAIGVGSMVFNFIYWNFGFLRMSTTGLTAQSFGKEDAKQISTQLGRGLLLALLFASVLIVFQRPILSFALFRMDIGANESILVETYFNIRIWAAPATLSLYVLMGWFFGLQNAFLPLILTLTTIMINIILNFIFVFSFDLGVAGLAWATVIAQYVGVLAASIMILYKYQRYLRKVFTKLIFEFNEMKNFMKLNVDIFIRTLFLTVVFWLIHEYSADFGKDILAVNIILLQFLNWMSYGVDGFAFAAESIVGKYKGRSASNDLIKAVKLCFGWGFVLALFFAALYGFGGASIFRLFTDDSNLLRIVKPYFIWLAILPIVATASYLWDGVFVGLTASRSMLLSMFVAFVCFLGLSSYARETYGNHGIWLMLFVFLFVRGFVQTIMFLYKRENLT